MSEAPAGMVDIHYHRPPDRKDVYRQHLLVDGPEARVSFARGLELEQAIRIDGRTALERGSDVVWFTFPDTWHDIGLFHTSEGAFTGTYANIITPCAFEAPGRWRTTDLFLDVWIGRDGTVHVLDEDEFLEAARAGWIDRETADRAWKEAESIRKRAEAGSWPPPVVGEWNRERALLAIE